MKKIKILLVALSLGFTTVGLTSCDTDFEEINKNPNNPEEVPVGSLFNGATRYLMEQTRNGWWSARITLPWMQYSAQNVYIDEDRYAYRDAGQAQAGWLDLYRAASNYKKVIEYASDKEYLERYGISEANNTIQASRIMLVYTFDNLITHFGDVPYWSYGNQDPEFQALQVDKFITPVYVSQEKIYKDLLKELKEAEALLDENKSSVEGDKIYDGDASKWKKLANSLRLRIANRVKAKLPEAQSHITDAITRGVFTSNEDNAQLAFGNVSAEGNPFWKTFYVDNRQDFFPNKRFVDLLKGNTGNFQKVDPRLFIFAAPKGLTWIDYTKITRDKWKDKVGIDPDDIKNYNGVPYGIPNSLKGDIADFTKFNIFSKDIINTTRPEVLIEFAEVSFILSELNGWDQVNYLKGVEASLDKWGVSAVDKATYLAGLAPATQENVMVQKYIALFMQGDEAWNEYRRTGYPTGSILLLPGQKDVSLNGTEYTFNPMRSGNVVAKDIPARLRYPANQQTLNGENWRVAVDKLSNKDEIDSKLFFAK